MLILAEEMKTRGGEDEIKRVALVRGPKSSKKFRKNEEELKKLWEEYRAR